MPLPPLPPSPPSTPATHRLLSARLEVPLRTSRRLLRRAHVLAVFVLPLTLLVLLPCMQRYERHLHYEAPLSFHQPLQRLISATIARLLTIANAAPDTSLALVPPPMSPHSGTVPPCSGGEATLVLRTGSRTLPLLRPREALWAAQPVIALLLAGAQVCFKSAARGERRGGEKTKCRHNMRVRDAHVVTERRGGNPLVGVMLGEVMGRSVGKQRQWEREGSGT